MTLPRTARVQEQESAGRRRSVEHGKGDASGSDWSDAYAGLMRGWTSFYQDLGTRLADGVARNQEAYEELMNKWTTLAGSTRKIVEDPEWSESHRELYDVWRNYANRIGSRMARAGSEGVKGYADVANGLQRYGDRMGEVARQVLAGKLETVKAEDVYGIWIDAAAGLRRQMDRAAELNREETEDLARTWMEFASKVESLTSGELAKDGQYAQFVDLWAGQSKVVAEALAEFIRGHDHQHEAARKTWAEHYMRMQESMAGLARAIGSSYEEMYRRFLEGGLTSLSDLPMFPMWWTRREARER